MSFRTINSSVIALMAFLAPLTVFGAVNAPYLISATAKDDHSIVLVWRNNDVSAQKTLILRKSSTLPWKTIDSTVAGIADYTDSSLTPSTLYIYALITKNGQALSDTSNALSATTLSLVSRFTAPGMLVSWVEGSKSITIEDTSYAS